LTEQAVVTASATMDFPEADESFAARHSSAEPTLTSVDSASALQGRDSGGGFTGEIVGRVVTLAELESVREEGADEATYDQLRKLIEETLTDVSEHEIVHGRVVSVGEKDVVIDIGFKSDGIVS